MSRSALMRVAKPLTTFACLAIVATVLWQMLPKAAFSSDISQVGEGRPAMVMLRDVGVMGGERVLEQMLEVYPEFEQQMIFLVVHTGIPAGVDFAAEHGVTDGQLVLFSGEGNVIGRSDRTGSADALRRFIRDNLPSS